MNRFFRSFIYAWNGIRWALAGQLNLKIHLVVAILAIASGFYFQISKNEWLAIVLAIGLVIAAELINTAIEHIVDLVSPEHLPLAGKIKDMAAAAVLITAFASVVIGAIIFGHYMFH